jgi:LEA14-like dessication related protein
MKQASYISIAFVLALVAGLFVYLRTNTKKLFKMAEFRVKGLKVGKPTLSTIPVDVDIEIFNPSDFAVPVKNYKVEIYRREGKSPELLSSSNVASVNVPANGSVLNKITFNLSLLQVLKTAASAISWDWQKIANDVLGELANKVLIKVYADVYNQFVEREISL